MEPPKAKFNRQSTTVGQRKVGVATNQFKRSNTKSISQSKKGKKNGATAKQQLGEFSLTPLHEQLAAANAQSSSEEVSEEYAVSDGDESNDSYWFTSSDEDEEEMDADDIAWKNNRMVMYAQYTHYDVIKEVAKFNFDYHLTKRQFSKWDIAWSDGPITIKFLQRMQPWQRTNHLPGIYNLAKKNMLGRHLMRLQSVFPEDYNFFPPTYNLPEDFKEFVAQIGRKRNKTFIVKPEASCQGKGIFLTRDPETLTTEKTIHTTTHGVVEHMVVQRYMHKPYLIDGYKFDLRIYVLVNGINPLRVYVYKDGLARFATVPYASPAPSNLKNLCMHLTNYAINKKSSDFVQNEDGKADDVGSKRSYQFILRKLTEDYGLLTKQRVQDEINDIIVKTMCLAQPHVHHLHRSCQPDDIENSQCFQILGFDIMIDSKLKASLIEVNQMPSFATDSPLDYKIKQGVINDAIALLNLSTKRRNRTKKEKKAELQRRLLKGYSHKLSSAKDDEVNPSAATNLNKKDETKDNASNEAVSSPDKISPNKEASSTTTQPIGLNKISSKANLGIQKKEIQAAAKKNIRQLALQSKQELLIRKRILREKAEEALCGGYELIYPYVTYAEEEKIQDKVTALKSQGHKGASVQSYIGLDAPKTLKEKLAQMHEAKDQPGGSKSNKTPVIARKASKESLDDSDTQAPQLGDNTIEFAAIEKLLEEQAEKIREEEDPNQQQGQNDGDLLICKDPLDKRWLKQIQYENFIECTRRMWDQFTTSASLNKQKRLNAKAEKQEKEEATKDKKDKARKDQARKNLYAKLKQQAEERKQRQDERQRALNGIQEEQDRSNSSRDSYVKDMLFPGDKAHEFNKGEQKLNMAELVEQHRQLTNQIADSQKKFLEDDLRRNRKNSSQLDVHKSFSTSNNQADDDITRKSSQKRKESGVPNTNYFAHIIQQQKQNQLEKNSQQHQLHIQQSNMEDHGIIIKSIEGLPKKRELQHQKRSFQSSARKGERQNLAAANDDLVEVAPDVLKHGDRSSAKSSKRTVEKLKSPGFAVEFPVDHILPVFNLNKKEAPMDSSNFIPVLKFKQKDINLNNKAKKGLVKGSTVSRKVEQAPIDSIGVPHHANPSQVFAGQIGAQQKSSGQGSAAFKERSQSHALADRHLEETQKQKQPLAGSGPVSGIGTVSGMGAPPNRYSNHMLQPTTDMAIMDNFSGSPMMFQNSIGANNEDSVHHNMNQDRKSILDQVQPILQEKSYRKNPQQFKTLEPIVQQKSQNNQQRLPTQSSQLPQKHSDLISSNGKFTNEQQSIQNQNSSNIFESLMVHQQKQQTRQPNVIMIGLDLDGKPSRAQDLKNTFIKDNSSVIRNYKSPQVDYNRKYSQRRDQFENMLNPMHSKQGPGTQQQTSGKANSLYDNISVQKQPYQRTSKLQEMFGDVQKKYSMPNYHSNVKTYPMSDHTASTRQNEQNLMALKYMENIFGPAPTDTTIGSGIVKKPSSSTNTTQQIQSSNHKSQRAILPEISDQHKSKEVSREVQNHSQLMKQNVPSDLSMSFQKNTFSDSKNNSAYNGGDTNSTIRVVNKRKSSNHKNDLMLMQGIEGQSFNPDQSKNMQYQNQVLKHRIAAATADYNNNQPPGDSFEQQEETPTHMHNSSAASRFGRNVSVLSGDAILENNSTSAQHQKSLFRNYMQTDPPFFPATQNRNSSLPGNTGTPAHEVILNGVNLRQQAETQEKKAQSGTINLGTQDNANAYFSLFNNKQAPQ